VMLAKITAPDPERLLSTPPSAGPMRQAAEQLIGKLLNGGNPPVPHIHNGQWGMKWSVARMVELYPGMDERMWCNAFLNIASNIPESYTWDPGTKSLIKL